MSAVPQDARFMSTGTYSNGTSINAAMSAFLATELTSVTTAVQEDSVPVAQSFSKRSAYDRPSMGAARKRAYHDHLDKGSHDGSNDGSTFSEFDSNSGAESSEGTSTSSHASFNMERSTAHAPRSPTSEAARARDRATRRARRAVEASKPSGKKKASGTLQSKDGARQRLKCLCKQYLTKFHAHPSSCVPQFLTCKQQVV